MLKVPHATDWIAIVLVITVALVGVLRHFFPRRFVAFFKVPVNGAYFTEFAQEKERPFWFNVILESIMIMSLSLFIYTVLQYVKEAGIATTDYVLLIRIALVVLLFFSLQRLFHSATGYLFNMPKNLSIWMHVKDTYIRWASLFIILCSVVFVFAGTPSSIPVIVGLTLLTLAYVIGVFKGSTLLTGSKTLNGAHIILYLCTLEIVPVIVVVKLVAQ